MRTNQGRTLPLAAFPVIAAPDSGSDGTFVLGTRWWVTTSRLSYSYSFVLSSVFPPPSPKTLKLNTQTHAAWDAGCFSLFRSPNQVPLHGGHPVSTNGHVDSTDGHVVSTVAARRAPVASASHTDPSVPRSLVYTAQPRLTTACMWPAHRNSCRPRRRCLRRQRPEPNRPRRCGLLCPPPSSS